MPGYVTHYIFGRDIYDHLKDSLLKQNLYINRAVYSLGQQGPDIFFYYLPAYVLHGHNLGHMAHAQNTNQFFASLLESRNDFKLKKRPADRRCLSRRFSRTLYSRYDLPPVHLWKNPF